MNCIRPLLVFLVLAIAGCDPSPEKPVERHEPVVVYAHGDEDEARLAELFAGFTKETGIPVTTRYGDSADHTDDVIGKRGSPPADVLLTSNVADIWRAADRGALRPIEAAALESTPPFAKDPDNSWVAFEAYVATIGQAERIENGAVGDYATLAGLDAKGEVCLSSSALPINRAAIGLLMAEKGVKDAERIVRGWVRNLALPPFDSEEKLIKALQAGTCGYGIFSDTLSSEGVERHTPKPLYYNVQGLGVARHARYPASAQLLVDWLVRHRTKPLEDYAGRNIGEVGWLDEDAGLLAERAGYR